MGVVFLLVGLWVAGLAGIALLRRSKKASNAVEGTLNATSEVPKGDKQAKKDREDSAKKVRSPEKETQLGAPALQVEIEGAARRAGISTATLQKWLDEKKGARSKKYSTTELYKILEQLEHPPAGKGKPEPRP